VSYANVNEDGYDESVFGDGKISSFSEQSDEVFNVEQQERTTIHNQNERLATDPFGEESLDDSPSRLQLEDKKEIEKLIEGNTSSEQELHRGSEGFPIKCSCKISDGKKGVYIRFVVDQYKEDDQRSRPDSDYFLSLNTISG